jgi:hypothetical protein
MSTRCMIEVEGCKAKLYRHSDGYPDGQWGVLATLVPFVNKFLKVRGWDPEYLLARIAQDQMNGHDEHTKEHDGTDVLGFGLDTSYHFDLEYVYRVCEKGTIEVWETDGTSGEPARKIKSVSFKEGAHKTE